MVHPLICNLCHTGLRKEGSGKSLASLTGKLSLNHIAASRRSIQHLATAGYQPLAGLFSSM